MSTTPLDSWAVDLADVTLIYPMVGWEMPMAILAIVLWIVWQIWQSKFETQTYKEEAQKFGTSENITKAISGD